MCAEPWSGRLLKNPHARCFQGRSEPISVMTSIDDRLSEIKWVRNEIWRCRRLLKADLPDAERKVVEKRLLEQLSAFECLLATAFPLTFNREVDSTKTTTIRPRDTTEAPIENAAMVSTDGFSRSTGG